MKIFRRSYDILVILPLELYIELYSNTNRFSTNYITILLLIISTIFYIISIFHFSNLYKYIYEILVKLLYITYYIKENYLYEKHDRYRDRATSLMTVT